jgi:hypothetical protein
MLQGTFNASKHLLSLGVDGTFYYQDLNKKNNGLKLKPDVAGITFSDTLKGKHTLNDTKYDFIQYLSEHTIDSLIDSLLDSGTLKNENYNFKARDLYFVEGLKRAYGDKIDSFKSSIEAIKCMVTHSQEGF